MPNTEELMKL